MIEVVLAVPYHLDYFLLRLILVKPVCEHALQVVHCLLAYALVHVIKLQVAAIAGYLQQCVEYSGLKLFQL